MIGFLQSGVEIRNERNPEIFKLLGEPRKDWVLAGLGVVDAGVVLVVVEVPRRDEAVAAVAAAWFLNVRYGDLGRGGGGGREGSRAACNQDVATGARRMDFVDGLGYGEALEGLEG